MTMSALSITNPMPSERRVTGGILFLLAGLAALGALATNIILPAFPRIGAALGVSSQELELMLSSFFVAFAFGQLLVGPQCLPRTDYVAIHVLYSLTLSLHCSQ
jgi:MFS transporter, DHA1 family, multidrug resistance protein